MTLAELREALRVAQRRLIAANEQIEAAGADADVDALQREFDDADAEVRSLKQRITRAQAAEAAQVDLRAADEQARQDEAARDRDARDAEERARAEAEERAREEREAAVAEARADAVREAEARFAARASAGRTAVGEEARTYRMDSEHTFLRDLLAFKVDGDQEARERLIRSNREMRAQSTAAGSGGEFLVPELYLPEDYAKIRDFGRPFANAIGARPLPDDVDEIRVPKVRTGVTAAPQREGTAYATGDLATAEARAKVEAIGHYNDLSRQSIERSLPTTQAILIEDQLRSVNSIMDGQLITGSGTSPQVLGIRNVSGIETATYTDSTATGARFVAALHVAFGKHLANKQPHTAVLMHPRRWAWLAGQSDSQGRPFVLPAAYPAINQWGENRAPTGGISGMVGTIAGVPVFVDGNGPTNVGTGTNQDVVHVLTIEDLRLWESTPKVRVLDQPVAHQGQVRVLTYVDVAFMPDRFEKAITEMTGTGLTAP